jgi:hypothetical protein
MIDLDRFWMDDEPAGEDREDGPEATPGELASWEARHGVVLPRLLHEVLARRNGGALRDAPIEILPLDQIKPVGEEFWERAWFEEEIEDRGLVFEFAQHGEVDLGFLLDYNARGPEGEPRVLFYTHGDCDVESAADSFEEFLEAEVGTEATPAVDWDETSADADVLGRELVETSSWDGASSSLEQVLVRRGEGLLLYTRLREGDAEVLTKTTLPGPIVAPLATINAYRPPPTPSFALHLQSHESEGIVYLASSRAGGSGWKNTEAHGTPIYVAFESADRGRLEELRAAVLGSATGIAESREASRNAAEERPHPTSAGNGAVDADPASGASGD